MTGQQLYKLRHPERVKESKEKWRKANLDKHAAHSKAWRDRNPEKAKETYNGWAKRNPDKIANKRLRREALLNEVIHEDYLRTNIYNNYEGICQLCYQLINLNYKSPHTLSFTIDHIKPISLGGNDTEDNVQPAHYGCNSRKGNRI